MYPLPAQFVKPATVAGLVSDLAALDGDLDLALATPHPPLRLAEIGAAIDEGIVALKVALALNTAPTNKAEIELAIALLETRSEKTAKLAGGFFENRRSLMANAQNWAIHFSNIRLGLTTFLVSISWGVVALRWDAYDPQLGVSAALVWCFAVLLFATFTEQTFSKERLEKESLLVIAKGVIAQVESARNGWHRLGLLLPLLPVALLVFTPLRDFTVSLILVALACGFIPFGLAVAKQPDAKERKSHLLRITPDIMVVVATVGFGLLLTQWRSHDSITSYSVQFSAKQEAILISKLPGPAGMKGADGQTKVKELTPLEIVTVREEFQRLRVYADGLIKLQQHEQAVNRLALQAAIDDIDKILVELADGANPPKHTEETRQALIRLKNQLKSP